VELLKLYFYNFVNCTIWIWLFEWLSVSDVNLTNVVSFLQLAQMSTRGDQTCLVDYSIEHQTSIVYSMDTSNLCCLQYWHIKLSLFTVWTHRSYVVYSMDTLNLHSLQHGPIKLMLFMEWTHQTCCLRNGPIKLKLFTVWTHQSYAVYNMDPLNLCCLWNGPIKLKLLTVWTYRT
jgi:hypothetical protein